MTAPELKPCPFCGAVDPEWLASHVVCDCGATGPRQDVDREYQADAMRALTDWNRRADLAAVQPAQVRVKPLVWEEDEHGNFRAQSVRGGEGVDRLTEPQVIGDNRVIYEAWGIKDSFDDPVAAMSAVEAEISSEILAAIEPQPDPRDEVIKGLVDALCEAMIVPEAWYISGFPNISVDAIDQTKRAVPLARAALAAAKAVQRD